MGSLSSYLSRSTYSVEGVPNVIADPTVAVTVRVWVAPFESCAVNVNVDEPVALVTGVIRAWQAGAVPVQVIEEAKITDELELVTERVDVSQVKVESASVTVTSSGKFAAL